MTAKLVDTARRNINQPSDESGFVKKGLHCYRSHPDFVAAKKIFLEFNARFIDSHLYVAAINIYMRAIDSRE